MIAQSQFTYRSATGADMAPLAREIFGNVRIVFPKPMQDVPARLETAGVSGIRFSRISATPHTAYGEDITQRSFDPDNIKFVIQEKGHTDLHQGARQANLRPGTMMVYDPTQPYVLDNPTSVRQILLQVPRRYFDDAELNRLNQPISATASENGLVTLLQCTISTVLNERSRLRPNVATRVAELVTELVSLLYAEDIHTEFSGERRSLETLRLRARELVLRHAVDPDFSVADLARRLGCSLRYVYRAFETEQMTPAEYIWDTRLTSARSQLLQQPDRPVSAIAFAHGFSSSAHFSRAFKIRFLQSPSALRKKVAAGEPPQPRSYCMD